MKNDDTTAPKAEGGTQWELKTAEDQMIAATTPEALALAQRRHLDGIRNYMQAEMVPSFERALGTILDTKLAPITTQLGSIDSRSDSLSTLVRDWMRMTDGRVDVLHERVDVFEARIDVFDGRLGSVEGFVQALTPEGHREIMQELNRLEERQKEDRKADRKNMDQFQINLVLVLIAIAPLLLILFLALFTRGR